MKTEPKEDRRTQWFAGSRDIEAQKVFRALSITTKIICRIRGLLLRTLVILAGGSCGPGLRVEKGLRIRQGIHRGWSLGKDVYIGRNTTVDCIPGAELFIGNNVTLTEGIFISVCEQVKIGNHCLIGEYSSIRDANHDISDMHKPIAWQPMLARPITISDNVWIGRGCAILSGTTIAVGAVVGANSTVNKSLAEEAIYAGSPAKLIRKRSSE